jgi:hypothetical protein
MAPPEGEGKIFAFPEAEGRIANADSVRKQAGIAAASCCEIGALSATNRRTAGFAAEPTSSAREYAVAP